ncbi:hypothetical protein ACI3SI_20150, partial [Lactococcus lactis]
PSGTYLSGGAGYNNTVTHVGSGVNNSISVNISANAASGNVLNGAVIYSRTNVSHSIVITCSS